MTVDDDLNVTVHLTLCSHTSPSGRTLAAVYEANTLCCLALELTEARATPSAFHAHLISSVYTTLHALRRGEVEVLWRDASLAASAAFSRALSSLQLELSSRGDVPLPPHAGFRLRQAWNGATYAALGVRYSHDAPVPPLACASVGWAHAAALIKSSHGLGLCATPSHAAGGGDMEEERLEPPQQMRGQAAGDRVKRPHVVYDFNPSPVAPPHSVAPAVRPALQCTPQECLMQRLNGVQVAIVDLDADAAPPSSCVGVGWAATPLPTVAPTIAAGAAGVSSSSPTAFMRRMMGM